MTACNAIATAVLNINRLGLVQPKPKQDAEMDHYLLYEVICTWDFLRHTRLPA